MTKDEQIAILFELVADLRQQLKETEQARAYYFAQWRDLESQSDVGENEKSVNENAKKFSTKEWIARSIV